MYICKCMHIWLCMFTYTHIYLHMYIHAYTCIRKTMQRFWLVFLGENETLRRLRKKPKEKAVYPEIHSCFLWE